MNAEGRLPAPVLIRRFAKEVVLHAWNWFSGASFGIALLPYLLDGTWSRVVTPAFLVVAMLIAIFRAWVDALYGVPPQVSPKVRCQPPEFVVFGSQHGLPKAGRLRVSLDLFNPGSDPLVIREIRLADFRENATSLPLFSPELKVSASEKFPCVLPPSHSIVDCKLEADVAYESVEDEDNDGRLLARQIRELGEFEARLVVTFAAPAGPDDQQEVPLRGSFEPFRKSVMASLLKEARKGNPYPQSVDALLSILGVEQELSQE